MRASALVRAGQFNQAVRQAAYIFIALALPRLGVPTEQIGEWETLLFLGYLLGFGWTTGLLQGFLVKMGELTGALSERFARRAVLVTMALSAALLLLSALLHTPLFAVLQLSSPPIGWYFFFLLLLSRWPSYCFEQALLLTDRVLTLTLYTVINALALCTSLLLPLYLGYDLLHAMQFLGAYAGAKTLGILIWSLAPTPTPRTPHPAPLTPWLITSKPLIAYATIGALVTAVDPWIVNYWSGGDEATFAIFRYGVRELPFLAAMISGMVVVTIPTITREGVAGMELLKGQSRRLYHLVFGLTFLLLLTADYWWTLVFTDVFAESLPIFRTYLLVVGCRLVFAMTVLTALNQTRRIYLWGILELVVNVILSLALAPYFGLMGIIWGTVVASYFHEVCLVLYLRYRTATGWAAYADLRWYFGYLLLLFVCYTWLMLS